MFINSEPPIKVYGKVYFYTRRKGSTISIVPVPVCTCFPTTILFVQREAKTKNHYAAPSS